MTTAQYDQSELMKLLKGTFYTLGSMLFVRLLLIVNSVLVARMLGPRNLGLLTVLDTILATAILVSTIGVPLALAKYLSEYAVSKKDQIGQLVGSAFNILLAFTVITCLALIFTRKIFTALYVDARLADLLIISSITLFFLSLIEMGTGVLRGYQEIKLLSIINPLKSLVLLPITIALIYFYGLPGAVLASLAGAIIGVLILAVMMTKVHSLSHFFYKGIPKETLRLLTTYGLPTTVSSVLVNVPIWFAVTILTLRVDLTNVGFFRVANSLVQLLLFVPLSISIPMVPIVARINTVDRGRLPDFFRIVFKINAYIMLAGTLCLTLFSRTIVPLLFGTSYCDAWQILFFLCVGTYFSSVSAIIGYMIAGTGRMWEGCALNLVWAGLFSVLSFFMIGNYGLLGMGLAYLLSYAAHSAVSAIYLCTVFKIRLSNKGMVFFLPVLLFAATYSILVTPRPAGITMHLLSVALALSALLLEWLNLTSAERGFLSRDLRERTDTLASVFKPPSP